MRYNNYHSHKIYSNIRTLDVITKPQQYIDRTIELGHTTYFTTEHGYQGNVHEAKTLCDKSNLKMIVGAEFYYVNNINEKDRGNYHLIIIAKNNNGYKQINKALSLANTNGYYYKPRIDEKILFEIFKPEDVVITTACVAGVLKLENREELIIKLKNHFKDNFFLEVQSHPHKTQVLHNVDVLELSKKYNIDIIHANDSHYIYPEESKYRTKFLKAKGINYPEEDGFILDYPNSDDIFKRYEKQNVLTKQEIEIALKNTLIFDECEEVTLINEDIKLPSISKNPNKELKEILNKEWLEKRKNIPENRWNEYLDAIRYEFDIIEKTHMEDYFIIDYKIVQRAKQEYNGLLTKTGRGSAPSFIITNLLGLTEIDRLNAPVPLFPTRFMSVERILSAKSLPDIDLNAEDAEPFIQATRDLLGEENCAWMISYKPLQDASAFRLWCKANDMKLSEYDEVAKNLDKYINDDSWRDIIKESKVFVGVVESVSFSPCSMLIYDKPIDEEVGLLKTKDGICCNIDGYYCDKYKYLKNDYLTVKVWSLIRKTCELANINIPTIEELNSLLNSKTYEIYKNKLTCTINQVDSDYATNLASKYKISSVAETSAFVASIRPGFTSLLDNFIKRKPYTTNVKELDILLEDSYHYLMYQESIMKYLIWLGIEESESYDIIKKVAKKKFKEKELKELHTKLKNNWIKKVGTENNFEDTWQVVNDATSYSFNASHSLSYAYDSLYCAYLKSHYPLEYYTVAFNLYNEDTERTRKLTDEIKYFDIKLENPKFRFSKSEYFFNRDKNSIYKGIESIKFLNSDIGEYLYSLKDNKYDSFLELLIDLQGHINSKQLSILIKLDFFEEFGKSNKLLETYDIYNSIYSKKQFKKDSLPCNMEIMRRYSNKETEKIFKEVDTKKLCSYLESQIENTDIPISEKIQAHFEFVGSCNIKDDNSNPRYCLVIDIDTKYSPKITLYNLKSSNIKIFKVSKSIFDDNKIDIYDLVYLKSTKEKAKSKKIDGKWIKSNSESEWWIQEYWKLEN
ncbi:MULTISPECIES: PHP domain-containing protein [unclassified Clostridioides]|uniref:PHP domain-containing protein n=2 Tax=Clostridioides TaxID=1870884 RepID=UPI001D12A6DC|nr:PHP domain-containing protein [Clostridioides sp. ES-W-0018-02]MCC0682507.1 PHP domain-containing protein [Clostridioides sp. ES-S-0005-03]MCC0707235.1 PHP domain-containing protein [Clostridioides sp. ES-S-0190-01]MCC0713267.1 PHP domain-containing protein [Clostridioides sp. ES-W-0017-02]